MVASLAGQSVPVLAEDRLRLPAGLPPALEVRLADVDLDGRLDLLRLGSDTLDVLLQTPSGEFEPHPAQGRATFPGADFRSLAVGHLGLGGAAPDLVLARAALPPLVLGNDGSGRFTVGGILLPLPPAPVASVLVGDLDGVPPDDLLVLPEQGRPQLLLGQNVIGYRDASQLLPANLFVQAPLGALADLDGDGDLDVVVASRAGAAPFVLDNNAGFQRQVALPFVGACAALAVADFDGDRRLDVALARVQPAPGNVEFVRNRATGFAAYVPAVAFPLDASVARLVAADLSRAGTTDLVLLQEDGRVRVAVNDGQPNFGFRHPAPILGEVAPRSGLAVGDLEGDGDLDLVVGGGLRTGAMVRDSVLLARASAPDWLDTEAIGFPIALLPGSAAGAAVDFDGDGELDVVGYGPAGLGHAWRNDGSARFTPAAGVLPALPMRDVRRVVAVSIDTPRRDLLVLASPAGGTASPPGVRLLLAQPGGYVDATGRLPLAFRGAFADVAAARVQQPATRLLDDLVLADTAGNLAVLANGNGSLTEVVGAFQPAQVYDSVRALLTGDVDGDGLADVVVLTYGLLNGGGMQVFLRTAGNAPPLFVEAPRPVLGMASVVGAELEDFDGDGRLDVLVFLDSSAAQPLRVFTGDGRGGFQDATATLFTPPLPARVDAGALVRRPGQEPALLLGRSDGGALSILRRQGGRYAAPEEQPVHGSPRCVDLVVADFDTDGDDDCAVFPQDSNPGLLLGTDLHFAARTVAQAGREVALRARGPDPGAIAAWLWSPGGAARLPFPGLGIVRLAPPVVSLAVFPFGPTQTLDLSFPAPPIGVDVVLPFQLAAFDVRFARTRLSNLAPVLLTAR